jgi:hypothetical protein
MSLVLDLPPELESELAEEAARLRLPLAEYALRLIHTARGVTEQPRTGADLVAYWEREGVIGSRPQIADSQAHARELRSQAQLRDCPAI